MKGVQLALDSLLTQCTVCDIASFVSEGCCFRQFKKLVDKRVMDWNVLLMCLSLYVFCILLLFH